MRYIPCNEKVLMLMNMLAKSAKRQTAAFVVFAAVCLLALFANMFININTFSLHGMYRMRLTRSYLGASNFARHPDAFTNFDSSDNMYDCLLYTSPSPRDRTRS